MLTVYLALFFICFPRRSITISTRTNEHNDNWRGYFTWHFLNAFEGDWLTYDYSSFLCRPNINKEILTAWDTRFQERAVLAGTSAPLFSFAQKSCKSQVSYKDSHTIDCDVNAYTLCFSDPHRIKENGPKTDLFGFFGVACCLSGWRGGVDASAATATALGETKFSGLFMEVAFGLGPFHTPNKKRSFLSENASNVFRPHYAGGI